MLAEYTEAPASLTMTYSTFWGISFRSSTMNCSDSLEAVPFPREIREILYLGMIFFSRSLEAFIFWGVVGAVG